MTVIKLFFPTKTRRETQAQRRVEAPMERAVAAASGLIALLNHSQGDVDEHSERVELLDSLQCFLDEEMDEMLALDVLDVPVFFPKRSQAEHRPHHTLHAHKRATQTVVRQASGHHTHDTLRAQSHV
jgi:hypothetical protein